MNKQQQIIQLRTKKIAALIMDARRSKRRTEEECASALGISIDQFKAFETGQQSPSLPELEALAFYLDIPLEQFWSHQSLSELPPKETIRQKERLRQLRSRMIGASIKMARTQLNFSLRELSLASGISENDIKHYELGEAPAPLPELELLAQALDMRVEDFFDKAGPIGKWRAEQIITNRFLELPPELQEFVVKPVNRPFIDLAIRLSALNVDKLRSVAEGLLEITY
jgi:transcriptional regulator with XRE-family HTH domain